jgi:hypothetical protein
MLQPMEWLWDRVSLLQFVELPWRLLGAACLCLAMLAGALGTVLAGLGRWRKPAMAAALALLIVPNLSHLHPRAFREIDPAFWTPRLMAVRGFESTAQSEVTPKWVNVRARFDPEAAHVTGGAAEIRQTGRTPFSWSADVTARAASTVRLSIAYYPGWEVSLDGHPAEIGPTPENGLIQFQVPPGEHRAEAVWNGTAVERWSDIASLVALGVWLAALLFRRQVTQPAIGPTPPVSPIEGPRQVRRKPMSSPERHRGAEKTKEGPACFAGFGTFPWLARRDGRERRGGAVPGFSRALAAFRPLFGCPLGVRTSLTMPSPGSTEGG